MSVPNGVYGGIAAEDAEAARSLQEHAMRFAVSLGVDYLELRDHTSEQALQSGAAADFHVQDLYVAFDCAIVPDEEAQLASFKRELRRMVRVGGKNGLSAHFGREEHLDEFYEVYALSLSQLGTPVFPRTLFETFLEEFPTADIMVVRQGSKVASAVMSFYSSDAVHPYYAGAYPQFYRAGVNNFMYWELMKSAAARGCTRFDFGRSKKGTGAYAFKRTWDMRERELPYRHYLVRAQAPPNVNPTNPRFSPFIEAWKKLPLGVAKFLGPMIVKHLP